MDNHYLLGIFVVMGVATFITRVLPFVALTKAHDHPFWDVLENFCPP